MITTKLVHSFSWHMQTWHDHNMRKILKMHLDFFLLSTLSSQIVFPSIPSLEQKPNQ